jgi:CHASE1-domain containing sensor protein
MEDEKNLKTIFWDQENGIIHHNPVGKHTASDANQIVKEMNRLLELHPQALLLIDVSEAVLEKKVSSIYIAFLKSTDIPKISIIRSGFFNRMIINSIMSLSGMRTKARNFRDEESALAWLATDKFSRDPILASVILFIVVLIATVTASIFLQDIVSKDGQVHFETQTDIFLRTAEDILYEHSAVLTASNALFVASDNVNRSEWKAFVSSLIENKKLAAFLGLGYVQRVKFEDQEEFLESIQNDEYLTQEQRDSFAIFPQIDADKEGYVVTYIEPFEENIGAFGFDLTADSNRKSAIELARDTGKNVLSRPIDLVADEGSLTSLLLVVPVYGNGLNTDTLEARRENIIGVITAAIHADTLFQVISRNSGITDPIYVDIHDLSSPDLLVVIEGMGILGGESLTEVSKSEKQDGYSRVQILSILETDWEISFSAPVVLQNSLLKNAPYLVVILGVLMGIFIIILYLNVSRTRRKAQKIAVRLTRNLSESSRLMTIATQTADIGVWRISLVDNTVYWSPEVNKMHGVKVGQAIRFDEAFQIFDPEIRKRFKTSIQDGVSIAKETEADTELTAVDYNFVNNDGTEGQYYWVGQVIVDEKGKPVEVIGIVQDISLRKQGEIDLKENVQQLSSTKEAMENVLEDLEEERLVLEREKRKRDAILESIGEGIVVTDQDGKIILTNESATKVLGFSSKEMIGSPVIEVLNLFDEKGVTIPVYERPSVVALSSGQRVYTSIKDKLNYSPRNSKRLIPVAITVSPFILFS